MKGIEEKKFFLSICLSWNFLNFELNFIISAHIKNTQKKVTTTYSFMIISSIKNHQTKKFAFLIAQQDDHRLRVRSPLDRLQTQISSFNSFLNCFI